MPEGIVNLAFGRGAPLGAGGMARMRGLGPAVALTLLAALSACASDSPRVASSGYNRPASYDPPGPPSDPWGPYIRDASRRFDVPERWIREVMRQESGGRISATSRVGAMGLMQLMPGTYAEMQSRYGLGNDPYHPYDNLMAGTAYVRQMYDLYGAPAFLAAYNAGPRRLEDYLWNGRGLPNETRNYVGRIGPRIAGHHPTRRAPPEVYAAAEIPLNIPAGPRRMSQSTMLALREQRNAVDPGIQVAQLPAGQVIRMEPIPDGSTGQASAPAQRDQSVQLASLSPVIRMDPIPDGSTYAAPIAPQARGTALATPSRPAAPVTEAPHRAAPAPAASGRSVSLVSHANASPLPPSLRTAPPGGGWAVQVGAFGSEGLARNAALQAQQSMGSAGGRVVVQSVHQGNTTLYRARVTGLKPADAQNACVRLRARGACVVLSPDAQG